MLNDTHLKHLRKEIHKVRDEKDKLRVPSADAVAYHIADVVLTHLHNALFHALDEMAFIDDDCWLPVADAPKCCVEGKPYTVRFTGGHEYSDCIYYNGKFFPEINGRCGRFENQPQHFLLTN